MDADAAVGRVLEAMAELDIDGVTPRVLEALQAGAIPREVLGEGLSAGMQVVGERFERGDYFLTDLVLAGEVMKAGLAPLEPLLAASEVRGSGTVVLATVKGDIHQIGKNLVGMMLSSAGYRVIDLGVDVPAAQVVQAVRQHRADIVGLSVLLTTMVGQLRAVVEELTEAGLRCGVKVMIGGACTTPELARAMGCDAHGGDAVAAVRVCQQLIEEPAT